MKFKPSTVTPVELINMIEKSLNVSINNFDNLPSFLQDTSGKRRFSSKYGFPTVFQFFDLGKEKQDYLIEFQEGVIQNIHAIKGVKDKLSERYEIESWLRQKAKLSEVGELEFLAVYGLDMDIDDSDIDDNEPVNIWVKYYYEQGCLVDFHNGFLRSGLARTVFENKDEAIEYIEKENASRYLLAEKEMARPTYHIVPCNTECAQ